MASVLIIDDEKEICREFQEIMEDEGHEVHTATRGKQGIEMVRSRKIELVFLDVLMPGMEGREVYEEIRKFSDVPVVIMSGYMPQHKEAEVLHLGASACLKKPLDLKEVRELVSTIIAQRNSAGRPK